MKSPVSRARRRFLAVVGCMLVPALLASQECRCPPRPNGPGGGVKCAKDQIAICDPSKGECNCTCEPAPRGQNAAGYLSFIYSKSLDKAVAPSDIQTPKYQNITTEFLKTEKDGVFFLKKKSEDGKIVQVSVGLPAWLSESLKKANASME
jgi:hypothetical protein